MRRTYHVVEFRGNGGEIIPVGHAQAARLHRDLCVAQLFVISIGFQYIHHATAKIRKGREIEAFGSERQY